VGEIREARAQWEEAGEIYAELHIEAGVVESKRRMQLLTT
jgi:hypothetical protein